MDLSQSIFLRKFDEHECLSEGNRAEGKPELIYALYQGTPKLIKYWEKNPNVASPELEQLWLDEIRQLQRLKGYPNPENHIAYLDHSGKDSTGYYLVLETAGRLPLSYATHRWLKSITSQPANQLLFWKNIIRIIRAIDFLHSQGLLHRNLNQDSILIGNELDNQNFQLTGFEWSIRIQSFASGSFSPPTSFITGGEKPFPQTYSFSNDWYSLGVLIGEILRVQIADLSDITQPINTTVQKTNLGIREITLIRALLGISRIQSSISSEALNGQVIEEYIQKNILYYLDQAERTPFDIVFRFPQRTPQDAMAGARSKVGLLVAVQEKYEQACGVALLDNEQQTCFDFIKQDLAHNPVLLAFKYREEQALLLKGKALVYLLEPHKVSITADKTWDTAFCQSAFREMPETLKNNEYLNLDPQSIQLWTTNRQSQNLSFRSWQSLIEKLNSDETKKTEAQQDLVDGFIAYHLTEMAYSRTDIYPISVHNIEHDLDDPQYKILKLSSTTNGQLEDLSQVLGLDVSAKRLKKTLESEESSPDWILTSKHNFQEDDESINITFIESLLDNGKEIFSFRTKEPTPNINATLFIMPSSVEGTIQQLNRRANALELLDRHMPLIDNLLDPHRQLQDSSEAYQIEHIDNHLASLGVKLDDSKKLAFKNILYTLPTYLVQGPPGVGKTYLVTALIQHIFSQEPESRVLLTAQSHSTMHHLYQEVKGALNKQQGQSDPLIVKCIRPSQSNNSQEVNSELDKLAQDYLTDLTQSQLFIRSRNQDLKLKIRISSHPDERGQRYSLMNHLLRAANMVFTTTNSKYVEDMLTHKAQFDWSIMEEAGKVTGIELLSPLLLSHRRLMIGDHLQLPPYRAAEMQRILREPEKLLGAINAAVDGKKNIFKSDSIRSRIEALKRTPLDKVIQLMLRSV